MDKDFTFKYLVDEYAYGRVIHFTKTSLTVMKKDSTEVTIDFADIDIIERDIYQNRRWLEPFIVFGAVAPVMVLATPVVWAVEDGDAALETLQIAGIFAAITAPPLLIGLRKERYNLRKKWRIETQ